MSVLCTITNTGASEVAGLISVTAEDTLLLSEGFSSVSSALTSSSSSLATTKPRTSYNRHEQEHSKRTSSAPKPASSTTTSSMTITSGHSRHINSRGIFGRNNAVKLISLNEAIPHDFSPYYCAEVLAQPNLLTKSGRPSFTDRSLVDWKLNDLRSLLIVDQLRPQWGDSLPRIVEKGFRLMYMPLDASDEQIVEILSSSDLYQEHNFDHDFLVQTAKYTVHAARERAYYRHRRETPRGPISRDERVVLTRPEWRNIIENYLLNLGCEAQCRMEYKAACVQLKKNKAQMEQATSTVCSANCGASMTPARVKTNPNLKRNQSNSLLKRAILASASTSPESSIVSCQCCNYLASRKISLSRQEKQTIWITVQTQLYKRLGLDWEADKLV